METAISANPHPLLRQVISNEAGYAQQLVLHSVPAELTKLPGAVQTGLRALSATNPETLAQHLINNQIGYAQTITTSIGAAAHDFTTTGLHGLPASFQTALQDLSGGNTTGAVNALASGFRNLSLTGFDSSVNPQSVISVTPTGALGDLLPILSIPGQMAQNFASLFPAGSVAGHTAQNFANVLKTVTNFNVTSTASFILGGGFDIDIDTNVGLPLVLALSALGGPINALNALGSSAHTITIALQSGNLPGAVEGLLDAPANVVNGFLNGHTMLPFRPRSLGGPLRSKFPWTEFRSRGRIRSQRSVGCRCNLLCHRDTHWRPSSRTADRPARRPRGSTGRAAGSRYPTCFVVSTVFATAGLLPSQPTCCPLGIA